MAHAAAVLAVDDDTPPDRNPYEQLTSTIAVEIEAVVAPAESGEERQMNEPPRFAPREKLRWIRSSCDRRSGAGENDGRRERRCAKGTQAPGPSRYRGPRV